MIQSTEKWEIILLFWFLADELLKREYPTYVRKIARKRKQRISACMVCPLSSIVINTFLVCTCDCWCIGQRTTFFLLTSVKSFQSNSLDNGKQSKCFARQRFYQIILSLEEGDEKIRSNFKLIIWKRGSKTRSNF